ncbi:MAG: hypothetical protein ACD_3C00226G0015 [uncultured bacterium (gcode 4)]|uniref:Uncharacterized protein n=1 Tax=uncultured bacterium (gcode 4) TaxID=1234023 RepID=K2F802_9BACT|nr:MAG: hypothetical protein ACD_3C00226G0015 [uncultured bacterium (gcode 4)]
MTEFFGKYEQKKIFTSTQQEADAFSCVRISYREHLSSEVEKRSKGYIQKYLKEWWEKFFDNDINDLSLEPYLCKAILEYLLKENTAKIFEYDFILRKYPFGESFIKKALCKDALKRFALKDPEGFWLFKELKLDNYMKGYDIDFNIFKDIKLKWKFQEINEKKLNVEDFSQGEKEWLIQKAKTNPALLVHSFCKYEDTMPFIKEISKIVITEENYLKFSKTYPALVFTSYMDRLIREKPFTKEVIKNVIAQDPILYYKYIYTPYNNWFNFWFEKNKKEENEVFGISVNEEALTRWILRHPHDYELILWKDSVLDKPYFWKLAELSAKLDTWAALYILGSSRLLDVLKKTDPLSIERIVKRAKVDLIWKPIANDMYIKLVGIINNLHEEKDEIRFAMIENFDSKDLYNCIIKGREEVFTSSYIWIMKRLNDWLKKQWKDFYDLFQEQRFEWVIIFLEAVSSYWQVEVFLNHIKKDKLVKLLVELVFSVRNDLRNAIAFTDLVSVIKDEKLLELIWNTIKTRFKNINTTANEKNRLWVIGNKLKNKFNDPFFKNELIKYELPKLNTIETKNLFDKNWRNIQQYFFYNDPDGKSSYKNFLATYKQLWWKIEDHKTFVIIKSKQISRKQAIIFANNPEFDQKTNANWIEDIENYMKDYSPDWPNIVVHRWHSYHVCSTIEKVYKNTKMVFLWSCGWFQNVSNVLDKSKGATIITTKWTWTMLVNDPLFSEINQSILHSDKISWDDIWQKVRKKIENDPKAQYNFKSYVRPDQNLWVLFIKKLESFEN